MTRPEAEAELVRRLKGVMLKGGMSIATDGTNADLNGPMRRALNHLGITPGFASGEITDADLAKISGDQIETFYLAAEFYVVDTVASNALATSSTVRLGPRQESNKEWIQGLNNRWKYLNDLVRPKTPTDPGGGGTDPTGGGPIELPFTVRSQGTAHVWGVWHPLSKREQRLADKPPDTPKKPEEPGGAGTPQRPRSVVIDVGKAQHPFECTFEQVLAIDASQQPVGVVLPTIGPNDDGKQIRVQLIKQGSNNEGIKFVGIVSARGTQTITGVEGNTFVVDTSTIQVARLGESVLLIADEDNKRWLAMYHDLGMKLTGMRPIDGGATLSVDCDTIAGVPERIEHNWGTRDVDVTCYHRPSGQEVTIHVTHELNAITVTSALSNQYRIVLIGGKEAEVDPSQPQRIKVVNCDTIAGVSERIEHNWATRDVDVSCYDRDTGNEVTLAVVRELNAVTITSSLAGKYRIVIEESKQT